VCGQGDVMIIPSGAVRVLVAMRPVDFRKGMDGLAAVVRESLGSDPYSGVIYVFRARRADRVKLLLCDGTGRYRWTRPSGSALCLASISTRSITAARRNLRRLQGYPGRRRRNTPALDADAIQNPIISRPALWKLTPLTVLRGRPPGSAGGIRGSRCAPLGVRQIARALSR
jgi:hypothetical protein